MKHSLREYWSNYVHGLGLILTWLFVSAVLVFEGLGLVNVALVVSGLVVFFVPLVVIKIQDKMKKHDA